MAHTREFEEFVRRSSGGISRATLDEMVDKCMNDIVKGMAAWYPKYCLDNGMYAEFQAYCDARIN